MSEHCFWMLFGKTTCIAIFALAIVVTFTSLKPVCTAKSDFGRSQTGSKIPALYLYGEIVGMGEGLFRSFSRAKTWIDIAFLHQPIGNEPNVMEAR
ncbi:hypothetical protein [Nostoc sp. 'Peltigera membranacea cyanobiont' 210A]|uniref:hypothetical protein n=1 Tax=Nostoc sp. 'Peltigera membranacea cyanobiont' 210A TaxID=2014529 RepID=UPI00117D0F00|nr:hypothetical protein [Nostoc sp. 'Peltigera membranacea cyanobiont' 210A]